MKNFTINNLRTGDMVQTRNGKYATVMKDTIAGDILRYHTDYNSFSYISTRYNDDMTHKSKSTFDIMKVYRISDDAASNVAGDVVANPEVMIASGNLIWDRENPVFDINDIQTGDMVKTRNGKLGTVYLNTLIGDIIRYHTEKNSFSYLKNFTRDMKSVKSENFDVVEVYRSLIYPTSEVGDAIANPDKMISTGNLIYKRDEDVDGDTDTENDMPEYTVADHKVSIDQINFTLTDDQFDRLLSTFWSR